MTSGIQPSGGSSDSNRTSISETKKSHKKAKSNQHSVAVTDAKSTHSTTEPAENNSLSIPDVTSRKAEYSSSEPLIPKPPAPPPPPPVAPPPPKIPVTQAIDNNNNNTRGALLKELEQKKQLNKTDGFSLAEQRNDKAIKNITGNNALIPSNVFEEMKNMGINNKTKTDYRAYVDKKYDLMTLDIIDEKLEASFTKIEGMIPEFIKNATQIFKKLTMGRTPPWEIAKREKQEEGEELTDQALFNLMKPYKNSKNALYEHAAYHEAMELTLSNFKKNLASQYDYHVPSMAKHLQKTYKIDTTSFNDAKKQQRVFSENFEAMLVGARSRHNLQPEYLTPKDKNKDLLLMIASDDQEALAKIRHKAQLASLEKFLLKEHNPEITAASHGLINALNHSINTPQTSSEQTPTVLPASSKHTDIASKPFTTSAETLKETQYDRQRSQPTQFIKELPSNDDLIAIALQRPAYASNEKSLKAIDERMDAIEKKEWLATANAIRSSQSVQDQIKEVHRIEEPALLIKLTLEYRKQDHRKSSLLKEMISRLETLGQPPVTGTTELLATLYKAEQKHAKPVKCSSSDLI